MKLLLGILAFILTSNVAWTSPPSPPDKNPFPHHQEYDHQAYVPHGFADMSLSNHLGYGASTNPPIIHGYEHLEHHFQPVMTPYVVPPPHISSSPQIIHGYEHLESHFNPSPTPTPDDFQHILHYNANVPDEYFNEQPHWNYNRNPHVESIHYEAYDHHDSYNNNAEPSEQNRYHNLNNEQRRKSNQQMERKRGKQVMNHEQGMSSDNNFRDTESFVDNLYHEATFDHGRGYTPATDSEEEEEEEGEIRSDNDRAESSDDQVQAKVEANRTRSKGKREKQPTEGTKLDMIAKKQALFRQIWNEKGLSTDMDPEVLAQKVAMWRIEGTGGFDNQSIGQRAVALISETKPEDFFPEYLASYTEYMIELAHYMMRMKSLLNREQGYLEMKVTNKKLYDLTALKKAVKSIHQSRLEHHRKRLSSKAYRNNDPNMVKVIDTLRGRLQAQNIDIDQADLATLVNEGFSMKIEGIKNWEIIQYIKEYLVMERNFSEIDIKIFMRRARLKKENLRYQTSGKEYNETRARRRRDRRRESDVEYDN